jgi:hypothetical protein
MCLPSPQQVQQLCLAAVKPYILSYSCTKADQFFSAFEKAAEKCAERASTNGSYDQWATGQTRFA